MKHVSTRDLYHYWNARRGRRPAPERAEIDPIAIPRVLADTFLLGADAEGELVFRLAGTRVCALFCRELKGEPFVSLFDRPSHAAAAELIAAVGGEALPTVAGVAGAFDGGSLDLELLLLPLCHRGRTDARLLGVLAPIETSVWIGARPLTALSIGAFRHIGAFAETTRAPGLVPALPVRRSRHGLVVYDGGRGS
jgi:hypothetical protein